MTIAETVLVAFTLPDGRRFEGEVPTDDVVHLALDQLLPEELLTNHRLAIHKGDDLIYPDMFLYEIVEHYGDARFDLQAIPLDMETEATFTNYGFDHLALAFEDRQAAKRFFAEGLRMQVVRDDEHLTVVTSGNTALFLFDFNPDAPLAPPAPSRIHHLGFVVDDLEAAAAHLKRDFPEFLGHFTLLEREERLSLYGYITIGTIRFMLQLSQIKPQYRGLTTEPAIHAASELYDYASKDYGVRLG
jgi:hypothetical protein